MTRTLLSCAVVMAGTLPLVSQGAPPPDAGRILNEQQRATPPPSMGVDPPVIRTVDPPPAANVTNGLRVSLRSVRFSGATSLGSEEALQAQVRGAIGKTLAHAELQQLADGLTQWLRANGFVLARAYLPPQDLTAGDLEIALTDGRLQRGPGRVVLRGDTRIPAERLAAIANAALPDDALHRDDLERAVLSINDLPGLSARATLERGDVAGTSKLVIEAREEDPFTGGATLDNFSTRNTGHTRLGGHVEWNDPLRIGDALGLIAYATTGTDTFGAFYSAPLTPTGLRFNASASTLHYRVGGALEPLALHGSAKTAAFGVDYPLLRTRERSANLQLAYEHRRLVDDGNGANLRHRWLDTLTAGIRGNRFDNVAGGGVTEAAFALTAGRVDLSGNDADRRIDEGSARSAGGYGKATLRLSRVQSLGDRATEWSVFGSFEAQAGTGNLDSSEKFILGGPRGVRAYALGEAAGDDGMLATLELRRAFSIGATKALGFVFVDSGRVRLHHTRWTGSLDNIGHANTYGLSGVGIGVDVGAGAWSVRGTVARAIGANAGRAPDGTDTEGGTARNRVWLQASVPF